ncbi:MAG TPA: AAA family ATPase [Kofleriaceae bacterium]|nr:AAA family ATPase [Kofleriaceae bacterium]
MGAQLGEFAGTARFAVTARLGGGGMGIVYRAYDRERGCDVALKTLANIDAAAIFRFKQEFRALADVAHPNLVTLHELFVEDGRWFFTMELVDGIDLLTYVCGRSIGDDVDTPSHVTVPARDASPVAAEPARRGKPLIARLRSALPQLVRALTALHDSGHLHHDIKPSNVLVTPDGRVVVLDFGVITVAGRSSDAAGTPAYMAPEQIRELPSTPASDWYSLGVVLYQALAGHLPFTGSAAQILWDKTHATPPPVQLSRPDMPADLAALCMDLLRSEPAERPDGRAILERLGTAERRQVRLQTPAGLGDEPELVGREPQLAALREAFARSRNACTIALVDGVSGMGKSALVRTFVDEARRDHGALVFAGRCYERESVPYKAIDTVVDSVCEHLLRLPARELASALPPDAKLLATLFPVLRRIPALNDLLASEQASSQPPDRLRRRAFEALRELFARLARRAAVIVAIDDLQWGDADSAPLLDALVHGEHAPAMLVLASFRSDESSRSPLLTAWPKNDADVTRVSVGPLGPKEASEIAAAAFRQEGATDELAGAVALESGGSPFFLLELVRFASSTRSSQLPSLADVIDWRVDQLGADAKRVMEVLAVAGRPIEQRAAQVAGAVDDAEWPVLMQRLGAARVVRMSGRRGNDLVECYHDRIRESVAAAIDANARQQLHRRLAAVFQQDAREDAERVAHHFEAAGERELAARYALDAADRAAAALAFDRAVGLYRRAFVLAPDQHAAIRLRLAAALVNAGHGAEAADLYLEAAAGASGAEALGLRRLAAEQLLRSGRVDEGLVALRDVLDAVGIKLPATTTRSIPSLLWRRLRLRIRGLSLAPARSLTPEQITRLDITRTAMLGLALFDPVRSASFSSYHLRLALESGDAARVSFALAIEAGYEASAKNPQHALDLLARAEEIAVALGDPMLLGCVGVMRAIMSYERGEFRESFEQCERAEELIRDHLTGVAWEMRTVQMFAVHSLFFLGNFDELVRRTKLYADDARERGDLYAIMNVRALTGNAVHVIVHDDVAAGEAQLAEITSQLPASGFYLQHMFLAYARTMIDLYCGNADRAYAGMLARLPQIRGSLLLEDRAVRAFWTFLRANAALGIALADPSRRAKMLRVAARCARTLRADGPTPYRAMAHQIAGAIASLRGDAQLAANELTSAIEDYTASHMKVFACCAELRRAQILGVDTREMTGRLAGFGVASPARGARVLAAGFADPSE